MAVEVSERGWEVREAEEAVRPWLWETCVLWWWEFCDSATSLGTVTVSGFRGTCVHTDLYIHPLCCICTWMGVVPKDCGLTWVISPMVDSRWCCDHVSQHSNTLSWLNIETHNARFGWQVQSLPPTLSTDQTPWLHPGCVSRNLMKDETLLWTTETYFRNNSC